MKRAKWIPKVEYTSREDMIACLSGEDGDEDPEDLYAIGKYNEVEIAVVREDNKFGFESAGWADEDKIALFDCDTDMEVSSDEEADKIIGWWKDVASTIADALNKKGL